MSKLLKYRRSAQVFRGFFKTKSGDGLVNLLKDVTVIQ